MSEILVPRIELIVDQMLEPIIMGPDGLRRSGVVMLRKVGVMSHFVGIDLGTTNSAICSYDGEACGSTRARIRTTSRRRRSSSIGAATSTLASARTTTRREIPTTPRRCSSG